jgi:ABC-type multidrug transport system ATPase subunit
VNEDIISNLVRSCDLDKKMPARAKTLSGGQKRKLQLAMMLAGGSTVCCVDEVSTGLDPISRRRIWEILLAERSRRTIIMTTHFLDEADFLADNVVIMYKGSLKAEGTSAALKHRFGDGYTVKLPDHIDVDIPLSGRIEKEASRHQMVYRVATASLAAELIGHLERQGIKEYQVSGPTMEELFLKTTGDIINADDKSSTSGEHEETETHAHPETTADRSYTLTDGRPLSAFHQWWLLFCKRFLILKRRYIPYFVILAMALVGAGVSPFLVKSFRKPMECPVEQDLLYYSTYRSDFSTSGSYVTYVVGPPDMIDDAFLDKIAEVYSVNNTAYPDYGYYGFSNGSQVRDILTVVDTFEEFSQYIKREQEKTVDDSYGGSYSYVSTDGGAWLADPPTIMFNVQRNWGHGDLLMQNFLNIALSGVPISAAHSSFPETDLPDTYDFKAILFLVYYGLIMAAYPAFFALYPTNERISNVRSMQYSNGIRPLPLWLSHLAFDGIVVLIISAVGTGLIKNSTPVWTGLGYIFLILFLYGIVSALLSYVLSMFARSAVTAWFMCALGQVVFYFAYLGGVIGVHSSTPYEDLENSLKALYFGLGIISPVVSVQRAFAIGLGQFSLLCFGHPLGSINLFGGPILYLVLQGVFLSILLLWWDSSFVIPSFRTHKVNHDHEKVEVDSADLLEELKRLTSNSTDLHVESVTKSFGKNLAVDNVTFGVQTSEIFALLGPNGAGKSTIISMIRGDIKPSTSASNIQIARHSILSAPVAARSSLGVCPQFDSADVLTVTETLVFFAKTRGVADVHQNVNAVIAACGLEPWAHQLAQKLSGGTKRKLSLAVALVGNPKVLVLDEPSSALDANAKRKMWHTLQSVSKGRAVVLTTHSMEEADALADRIGIVSSRMLAVGEREALKKRAGDAFHIHLVSRTAPRTTPEELQTMKDWIAETFENANVSRETQGGQLRFEVSAEGHDLVGLIRKLEASKEKLGVEFYSVGKATLDEVFENIVRKYGDYNPAEK